MSSKKPIISSLLNNIKINRKKVDKKQTSYWIIRNKKIENRKKA